MIGDLSSLRKKFATTHTWAEDEQSGAASATEDTLRALAEKNQAYLDKFGYIFIVAAAEQLKITKLRLQKLAE